MAQQALQKFEQPSLATPDASEFAVIKETATMLITTGFLPSAIKTPEQAVAIILTGRELGIPSMAALNTINVIQGKPTVSPQLMLALIERSKQLEDIQIEPEGDGVRCTMKRRGRSPHTELFGAKEAKAMGLDSKDNYKKQPQTMYRWRAVAACARTVFPDVILGLYTPDEMGADTDEDGQMLPPTRPNVVQMNDAPAPAALPEGNPDADLYLDSIRKTCKELNALNDGIQWKSSTLLDYARDFFGDDTITDTDALPVERLKTLSEELGARLRDVQNNT